MEVINNVKDKIKEIAPGLPNKTLPDGTVSKVTVVPFYDRTGLIKETIGTLESALSHEILISIIVIIVLMLISGFSNYFRIIAGSRVDDIYCDEAF